MEEQIKQLLEGRDTSQFFAITVSLVAVIVTLVIFALWHRRKSAGKCVLIMGLSSSGKTLLHSRLLHSKFVQTQTSIAENVGNLIINRKSLKIVDIPGHERLRNKFFDRYKSVAKALIFVIDSVTIQKDIRDVAEFLYNVLSNEAMQKIPVLILCNKQDQPMSRGISVVKVLLDNEMLMLKITKNNQLEGTDASSKNNANFDFSELASNVQFAESNLIVKDNTSNPAYLDQVEAWLQKIA